ncbi:MAG: cupin domain-containing protein [Nitriliruptoraceae bacterium]
MTSDVHGDRRDPEQPSGAFDLFTAADELLEQARGLRAGRAARTLTPGAGTPLKQTLLALASGQRLEEHRAPGPATLQVLRGDVVLETGPTSLTLHPNEWAAIPPEAHDLRATSDAVVLLTVATPTA